MVRGLLVVMVFLVAGCNEEGPSVLVHRVEVTPAVDSVDVGSQVTFTATAFAADSSPLPGKQAIWVSGNPSIATVSDLGVVSGHGPGSTQIFAGIEGTIGAALVVVTGGGVFQRVPRPAAPAEVP